MAITTGILTAGSNTHLTSSEEANGVATDFISQGIVGAVVNTNGVAPATGGFAVNAQGSPNATVAVSSGVAYVTGTPTSQGSQTFRIKNSASANVTISANASGSTKYDWVYISLSATNLNTPNTAADNVATLVTSRSSNALTDDGTPPTYGYAIAVVTVANGFSTITNGNIADKRVQTGATSVTTTSSTSSWSALGYTPNSVTANGNRSYSLVFNTVNLTSILSNGMRLRTTRTVAAPTQCTSLNGTTQFYSKTSPAGMTFTNNFVVGAAVKPSAYQLGTINSRYNGTSGWALRQLATGQIELTAYNAGAANFFKVTSYQSVPLNKFVNNVAVQVDMTVTTNSPTTNYVMIDGVDVPAFCTRGGTNPTALVQAGNYEVGSDNGGLNPYAGKISQEFVYSAKVTQATILAATAQSLAGTETSLISAHSFNNSINDLNANANNLTANGSAVATNADSPFGGQAGGSISSTLDYGIIQSVTFSTNTTVVVQVPEGCTIPTSGGVSAVAYSTQKSPYGMPVQRGKWFVETIIKVLPTGQVASTGTWYNVGSPQLNVPIGEWVLGYTMTAEQTNGSTGAAQVHITLSTGAATEALASLTSYGETTGVTALAYTATKQTGLSLAAATQYYQNIKADVGAGTITLYLRGDTGESYIRAENAYL